MSPYRSDCIFTCLNRAWRTVSEDPLPGFLLIVRTGRIVTASCEASSAGYSEFPAYSQVLKRPLKSTVIVTAAVYRGLGSELRPCGLTLPRNLPAPGRRQRVYIALRLGTLLCF